jgi:RNA polymerase sigma factor (sigma-70 family)
VNTIALNLFRNWFRRRESPEELPEIATAPKMDPRAIDLHRSLDRCGPRDRQLLEEHYLEGYTSEELAQRTGCTPVAVRVRLMRVRRKLGAMLRADGKNRARSKRAQSAVRHSRRAHARPAGLEAAA